MGSGTMYRVPRAETHACDPSHLTDAEDIAGMNNMHEGPLLALLERRYHKDAIYTFTGDILISVNPYKGISGLYSIPTGDLVDYREKKTPHVFAGECYTYSCSYSSLLCCCRMLTQS